MANFNFTVDDLSSEDTAPFFRENTKDLPTGKPLQTSGSFNQTGTFNPAAGSSTLAVGELLMGPSVFESQQGTITNSIAQLTQQIPDTVPSAKTITPTASEVGATGSTNTGTVPASATAQAKIQVVIAAAQSQLGVKYSWGGGNKNGPTLGIDQGAHTVGFDCSGLMVFCFNKAGLTLAHFAQTQYAQTPHVSPPYIAGDMVFFGTANNLHHVGLVVSNGMMIDAPDTGSLVRLEQFTRGWDLFGGSRPFT